MAYAPLTAFFFVAVTFRFNALSASMNAIIFFSQMVSFPAVMNLISTYAYFTNVHQVDHDINLMSVADVVATVFGIWNLDFFRMFYKPYCLHPNLLIIQIMCLDYANYGTHKFFVVINLREVTKFYAKIATCMHIHNFIMLVDRLLDCMCSYYNGSLDYTLGMTIFSVYAVLAINLYLFFFA